MDIIPKGVVYIGNLPHGFYEENLKSFLSQFGEVTRLKVKRSDKNANPMGYAYVEFCHKKVASVVARTMHNYLMYSKILKCRLVNGDSDKIFRKTDLKAELCNGTKRKRKNQLKLENVSKANVLQRLKKSKAKLSRALGLKIDSRFLIQNPKKEDSENKTEGGELTKKFVSQKRKRSSQDTNPVTKKKQKLKKNNKEMEAITTTWEALNSQSKTPQKKNNDRLLSLVKETPIYMDIEDEDDEIQLKTPPNVIKRYKKSVKIGSLKKKILGSDEDNNKSIKESLTSLSDDANQEVKTESKKRKEVSLRIKNKGNILKPGFTGKVAKNKIGKKSDSAGKIAENKIGKKSNSPGKIAKNKKGKTDTAGKFAKNVIDKKSSTKKKKLNANKCNVNQSSDQSAECVSAKAANKSVKLNRKAENVLGKQTVMSKNFKLSSKKIKKIRNPNSKTQVKLVSFKKKTET